MSVSTLAQIESCPRRWSLEHADYSDRGLGHGFTERLSVATLSGRAAHCALERISRATDAVAGSTTDAVVTALRTLGGITKVVDDCIHNELAAASTNPRAVSRLEGLGVGLRQRSDELRLLVQQALRLRRLPSDLVATAPEATPRVRGALGYGYHPEVELRPPSLGWIGYADGIRLTPDECEIIDYKTGSPSASHEHQVRVYALLWARDPVVNPGGRLANSLVLVYPGRTLRVSPPSLAELEDIASDLEARSARAYDALRHEPPTAQVDAETCRYCDAKALCSDYWLAASQRQLAVVPKAEIRSLQGLIDGEVSASTASLVVQVDPYLSPGTRAMLVHRGRLSGRVGDCLRLLDVRVVADPDDDTPVVTFGPQSEAFAVP
jgi:hypothetical protein